MSQEALDIARRYAQAINSGEVPEDLFTEDFAMDNVTTAVTDRTYVGPEGVRQWIRDSFDVLDDARFEMEPVAVGDDWLVARLSIVGRGSVSHMPMELRYYGVGWITGGRLCRAVGYATRREALEAVGLPARPAVKERPGR